MDPLKPFRAFVQSIDASRQASVRRWLFREAETLAAIMRVEPDDIRSAFFEIEDLVEDDADADQ